MAQVKNSTENSQFDQEYMPFIVRWGRITNLLGVVLCFLPPLVLTFGFGFNPGLTAIITGALAQVSSTSPKITKAAICNSSVTGHNGRSRFTPAMVIV